MGNQGSKCAALVLTFLCLHTSISAAAWRISPAGRAKSLGQLRDAARRAGFKDIFLGRSSIVVRDGRGNKAKLGRLDDQGVAYEELAGIDIIKFANARFDGRLGVFLEAFDGDQDFDTTSTSGQFIISFRDHMISGWLENLSSRGIHLLEPLSSSAYMAYATRAEIQELSEDFLLTVREIPSGIKRIGFDRHEMLLSTKQSASVLLVDADPYAQQLVANLTSEALTPIFRQNGMTAYSVQLTKAEALSLSLLSGVAWIRFDIDPAAPSDERSNRIVGGTVQNPIPSGGEYGAAASWPLNLSANSSSPAYWDSYLSQLANPGISPGDQTIAFLDTGVDLGLVTSSSADCPPHLFDAGASACTLIYTNDLTAATADIRGDDFAFHGTLTTAIAAGFATPRPDGLGNDLARDSEGFSFTQGVAQGAKVAMATFLPATGSYRTPSSLSAEAFSIGNPLPRMRYSLLALSSGTTLPDNPESAAGSGPSARLFNHSWNTISSDYEASRSL